MGEDVATLAQTIKQSVFGNLNWGAWFYGLVSGFISGGSTAATSGVIASTLSPSELALGSTKSFKLMGGVFVMSGLMGMFAYLKQHPLPDKETK